MWEIQKEEWLRRDHLHIRGQIGASKNSQTKKADSARLLFWITLHQQTKNQIKLLFIRSQSDNSRIKVIRKSWFAKLFTFKFQIICCRRRTRTSTVQLGIVQIWWSTPVYLAIGIILTLFHVHHPRDRRVRLPNFITLQCVCLFDMTKLVYWCLFCKFLIKNN